MEKLYSFFLSETELKAELINFHIKENRAAHKTDNFLDKEQLLLRRGQAFDITVKFNRDYNPDTDVITLHFVAGNFIDCMLLVTPVYKHTTQT